jgi:hypothetical protein
MAPCRTGGHRSEATCEAFASRRCERSVDLGRQHSLAHQASARLNMLAERGTAISLSLKTRSASERTPAIAYRTVEVRIISPAVFSNRPGIKVPGTRRRSGSKPPLLGGRARRWPWRDREGRRFLRNWRFRRCTGRLNATQPGVLAVSIPYIRGLGAPCKGSAEGPPRGRRNMATLVGFPHPDFNGH